MLLAQHKEELCKAKCSIRAFWDHKTGTFIELEENYLNAPRKQ
jgi:hypothetical protein